MAAIAGVLLLGGVAAGTAGLLTVDRAGSGKGTTPGTATPTRSGGSAAPTVVDWSTTALSGVGPLRFRAAVDADRALYFADDAEDATAGSGELFMLDVAHRAVLWRMPTKGIGTDAPNSDKAFVVGDVAVTSDVDDRVRAVDLADGTIRSEGPSGWHLVGCEPRCPDLDGDVLLSDSSRVRRVPAGDLTTVRWTANAAGFYLFTRGAVGFGAGSGIDLRTGASIGWTGSDAFTQGDLVLSTEYSGASRPQKVSVLRPQDGSTLFTVDVGSSWGYTITPDLLVYGGRNFTRAVDAHDGALRWAIPSRGLASTPGSPDLPASTGLVAVPDAAGDRTQVVDVATGALRFLLPPAADESGWSTIGSVSGAVALEDSSRVVLIDLQTGAVQWSIPLRGAWASFDQVGDRLVRTDLSADANLATIDLR